VGVESIPHPGSSPHTSAPDPTLGGPRPAGRRPGAYNGPGAIQLSPEREARMSARQPRYSKEEHARRGTAIYEQQVRPQVEAGNEGKVVAIDVDSGAFAVAADTLTASQALLARHPNAQVWCVRIGHRAVHRFGPRAQVPRA